MAVQTALGMECATAKVDQGPKSLPLRAYYMSVLPVWPAGSVILLCTPKKHELYVPLPLQAP